MLRTKHINTLLFSVQTNTGQGFRLEDQVSTTAWELNSKEAEETVKRIIVLVAVAMVFALAFTDSINEPVSDASKDPDPVAASGDKKPESRQAPRESVAVRLTQQARGEGHAGPADLLVRFESGDLEAANRLYKYSTTCASIVQAHDALSRKGPASDTPRFLLDSLSSQAEECKEIQTFVDLQSIKSQLESVLAAGAHPEYMAMNLTQSALDEGIEFADQQAEWVLSSKDGNAIALLTPYLNWRSSVLFPEMNKAFQRKVLRPRDDALKLLACQHGWEACLPRSAAMATFCATQGGDACFDAFSMQDYLEHYVWSPARASSAYATLSEIQSLIDSGKASSIITFGGQQ